ncbi:MAG: hypothetical protein JST00_15790 [Deltaproteobacteria bacterium]|nr:hypothetical protein [Deltaproteobacteria bacterium]
MSGVAKAVERLVTAATSGAKDAALRAAVNDVLESFDASNTKDVKAALGALEGGMAKAEGRAAQVLNLALGALVEGGASADLAWPAASRGLEGALHDATRFARACVEKSKKPVVAEAIAAAGAAVAKKDPRAADAWLSLPSRCLSAIACLTRSKKLREAEHASGALSEAVYALEDAVEEAGFLSQALRILDGTVVLLHPESGRAFRLAVTELSSNIELYVLGVDALIAAGKLEGARPDPRAVKVLLDPEHLPKKPPTVVTSFHLSPWPGLEELWLDASPYDLPLYADPPKAGRVKTNAGDRVVTLEDSDHAHVVVVEPSFPALRPKVELAGELPKAQASKIFAALTAARESVVKKPKKAAAKKDKKAAKKAEPKKSAAKKSSAKKKPAAKAKKA